MNKINLSDNIEKGLSYSEIIRQFFSQVFESDYIKKDISKEQQKEFSEQNLKNRLNEIEIRDFISLPLPDVTLTVFVSCTQEEINKLISFDESYVTFEKTSRAIDGVRNKFCVYYISYDESEEDFSSYKVNLVVVKKSARDHYIAENVKKILVCEYDMACAKRALNNYGVMY